MSNLSWAGNDDTDAAMTDAAMDDAADAAANRADPEDVEEELHKLSQVLDNGLADSDAKTLKKLLIEVRTVIACIRRSPQAKAYFLECCHRVNIPALELLPFCNTRWESWKTVLERYLELKDVRIF